MVGFLALFYTGYMSFHDIFSCLSDHACLEDGAGMCSLPIYRMLPVSLPAAISCLPVTLSPSPNC